jgi:hypothetical protein
VDGRWAPEVLDGKGCAGSLAFREISDGSVYDSEPSISVPD